MAALLHLYLARAVIKLDLHFTIIMLIKSHIKYSIAENGKKWK